MLSRIFRQILRVRAAAAGRRAALSLAHGEAAHARGDAHEAERCWRQALEREPDNAPALCRIGTLLGERGDPAGAKPYFERARRLQPGLAEAAFGLGNIAWAQRDEVRAEGLFREALALDPQLAPAHHNLGRVRLGLKDRAGALEHLERAWALGLRMPELLATLSRLRVELGQGEAAIVRLEAEHAAHPHDNEVIRVLGGTYKDLQQPERARPWLERAAEALPDDPGVWTDLGIVGQHLGEIPMAIGCFDRALALNPGHELAAFHRALCLLLRGDFAAGWPGYEMRLKSVERIQRQHRFPRWDTGTPRGENVLVYAEQGVGDEIMFASCLPDLLAHGARVILEATPRLAPLLARSFPGVRVYPATGDGRVPADIRALGIGSEIPIGSLPAHFRRSSGDFPRHSGYLKADPARVSRWRQRLDALGPGLKAGLSWQGGTHQSRRAARSLTLEQLGPVLAVEGVRFVNLQYGDARDLCQASAPIANWPDAIDDLDETAALICALDRVISVCTAVIHLAGALGRPAWVLAPCSPEWRYGIEGERMPWYPSVTLLRQARAGDWQPVIADAARRLREVVAEPAAAPRSSE